MEKSLRIRHQLLIKHFFNRRDTVAIQNPATGKPLPVHPQDFAALVFAHVAGALVPPATATDNYGRVHSGHFRGGTYSPDEGGKTRYAALDFDGEGHKKPMKDPLAAALEVQRHASELGIACHLERSGGGTGYHLWFLFDAPVDAAIVRALLFDLAQGQYPLVNGDLADPRRGSGIEVFPKQDRPLEGGLGNFLWLPLYYGAKPGCGQFLTASDGALKVIEPAELATIPTLRLAPWAKIQPVIIKPKPRAAMTNQEPSAGGKGGYFALRQIARKCAATRALLHQCRRPPEGGMGHVERRTLAQICRQAGVADQKIAQLFKRQADFSFSYSLFQVRSLHLLPACKSISTSLGFCDGYCPAIRELGRGTPVAFLDDKGMKGGSRD